MLLNNGNLYLFIHLHTAEDVHFTKLATKLTAVALALASF